MAPLSIFGKEKKQIKYSAVAALAYNSLHKTPFDRTVPADYRVRDSELAAK